MKRFIFFGGCVLGVIFLFCPGVFSQEHAPAPGRGTERGVWAGMEAARGLFESYHAASSEAEKERIKAELRKTLSESHASGEAEAKARLERLEIQADLIDIAARRGEEETLAARIGELQAMVKEMVAEHNASREAGIDLRLQRLLAPSRERTRPEGR